MDAFYNSNANIFNPAYCAGRPNPFSLPVAQSIRVRCDLLAIPFDNFTSGDTAEKVRGCLKSRIEFLADHQVDFPGGTFTPEHELDCS